MFTTLFLIALIEICFDWRWVNACPLSFAIEASIVVTFRLTVEVLSIIGNPYHCE